MSVRRTRRRHAGACAADRTVYTGDILFIGGHPILWEGPVQNWIDACEKIQAMDVETIVPGNGPITTKQGVEEVRQYLLTIRNEARLRFEAGMSYQEAAMDIALGVFDDGATASALWSIAPLCTASLGRA